MKINGHEITPFDPIAHAQAVRDNPDDFYNIGVLVAEVLMRRCRTGEQLRALYEPAYRATKGHPRDRRHVVDAYQAMKAKNLPECTEADKESRERKRLLSEQIQATKGAKVK